jgi:hypothetical protein
MKKIIIVAVFSLSLLYINSSAQNITSSEKFGKTINVGVGIGGYSGYYGYVGHAMPVFHIDYENDITKNFTLAPFLSLYTYSNGYYRSTSCDQTLPLKYFTYHETVIPIGAKGTFYFDKLLNAGSRWDFSASGSIGIAIINSSWTNGYDGEMNYFHSSNPLFLDAHIGTEYHINKTIGVFLDISSGVSTVGIAIH